MMRAFEAFIGEPLRHRRMDLAVFRISQLLHDRTNGGFDRLYMAAARALRPKVALPQSLQMTEQEIASTVERLLQDGYIILPFQLPQRDVDEIANFAFSTPGFGRDLNKPLTVARDNVPEGEPRYYWRMDQVAALPAVQRMIAQGPYCAIAQGYIGCRPILASISLFLDRPFSGQYEPYCYHYDNDGPGFLKFFFFLTDVAVGTGAHYFLQGTQAHTKPKQFGKAAVYQEGALYGHYGRDREIIARGPAGTILAEDTSGFHRGSIIERDYRLMLQLQFAALDIPDAQELHRQFAQVPVPNLHPGVASIARKFMCAQR